MSLGYLLPLAITRLSDDPLISGDSHPGDLLKIVLGLSRSTWAGQAWSREKMTHIAEKFPASASLQDDSWKECYLTELQTALDDFATTWR
jgi:hypothetical protein